MRNFLLIDGNPHEDLLLMNKGKIPFVMKDGGIYVNAL
jgi:hypothetical protein